MTEKRRGGRASSPHRRELLLGLLNRSAYISQFGELRLVRLSFASALRAAASSYSHLVSAKDIGASFNDYNGNNLCEPLAPSKAGR
jgi:hypothetical protein